MKHLHDLKERSIHIGGWKGLKWDEGRLAGVEQYVASATIYGMVDGFGALPLGSKDIVTFTIGREAIRSFEDQQSIIFSFQSPFLFPALQLKIKSSISISILLKDRLKDRGCSLEDLKEWIP